MPTIALVSRLQNSHVTTIVVRGGNITEVLSDGNLSGAFASGIDSLHNFIFVGVDDRDRSVSPRNPSFAAQKNATSVGPPLTGMVFRTVSVLVSITTT